MDDGRPGPAGVLRRVAGKAATVLWWPVGMGVALLYAAWMCSPRRVPDLASFVRSDNFGEVQSAAAQWAEQNVGLIESAAPWLDRAGRWVFDRCETRLETRPFALPRDPPCVAGARQLGAVYGVDGRLSARLAGLAAALTQAGWGDGSFREHGLPGVPAFWSPHWSPGRDDLLPEVLQTMPPERIRPLIPQMRVAWVSQGQPATRLSWVLDSGDHPQTATAVYRPVEVSRTGPVQLASQALARHEHAIALEIDMSYYLNANVNAQPGRLRKRLLPVW